MIPNLIITIEIQQKLKEKHNVNPIEVHEAFMNKEGPYLEDTRENHLTDPPTEWFVAQTDRGRLLKVIFVFKDGNIFLKSAYDANEPTLHTYEIRSKQDRK